MIVSTEKSIVVQGSKQPSACQHLYGPYICGRTRTFHNDDALGHGFLAPTQAASEQVTTEWLPCPFVDCGHDELQFALPGPMVRCYGHTEWMTREQWNHRHTIDPNLNAPESMQLVTTQVANEQVTKTQAELFADWITREDHGNVKQLERCWHTAIASGNRRHSINPASLSAQRCAEILNAVRHRNETDWKAQDYGDYFVVISTRGSRQEIYGLDSRIITAWYLSRGEVGR
jgi:hypothetical protein